MEGLKDGITEGWKDEIMEGWNGFQLHYSIIPAFPFSPYHIMLLMLIV